MTTATTMSQKRSEFSKSRSLPIADARMSAGMEMFMIKTDSLRSRSPDHKLRLAAKSPTSTIPNIISICVTM